MKGTFTCISFLVLIQEFNVQFLGDCVLTQYWLTDQTASTSLILDCRFQLFLGIDVATSGNMWFGGLTMDSNDSVSTILSESPSLGKHHRIVLLTIRPPLCVTKKSIEKCTTEIKKSSAWQTACHLSNGISFVTGPGAFPFLWSVHN